MLALVIALIELALAIAGAVCLGYAWIKDSNTWYILTWTFLGLAFTTSILFNLVHTNETPAQPADCPAGSTWSYESDGVTITTPCPIK